MNQPQAAEVPCPCGSGLHRVACCEARLSGASPAPTAEALMRSRYTAYVLNDVEYLLHTWHFSTRPNSFDVRATAAIQWRGLDIVATQAGGAGDDAGSVEFIARYKLNGKAERLHEVSRFTRHQGRWFYVSGDIVRD